MRPANAGAGREALIYVRDSIATSPPPGGGRSARVSGPGGGDGRAAKSSRAVSWHRRHPTPDCLRQSDPPPSGEGSRDVVCGRDADTSTRLHEWSFALRESVTNAACRADCTDVSHQAETC